MSNQNRNDQREETILKSQQYRELASDYAALKKENEDLQRQLDKAGQGDNVLIDMALLADMAYRSYNAKALMGAGDPMMAPDSEQGVRTHLNFLRAFESMLDGIDEALNGFQRGSFNRRGLRENARYYHERLAEIAADKGKLFTTEGRPINDDVEQLYARWVEVAELTRLVEQMETALLRAYDNADNGEGEGYIPKGKRIAEGQKVRKERAEKAEAVAAQMDKLLAAAPKLDYRRAG